MTGGTRGIHGHRGPFEAQHVRDPARCHAGRTADAQVALHALRYGLEPGRVVAEVDPGEDAGVAAPDRDGIDSGPFEDLPGHLQEQPLLWVHRQGFTWGDAEELGVEVGGSVQESAAEATLGIGGVQIVQVPLPVLGEPGDGIPPLGEQLPQVFGTFDAARVSAAHGDDGNGLAAFRLDLPQPCTGLSQLSGDQLEVVQKLLFVRHQREHPRVVVS